MITIYHNPRCGKSRTALAAIKAKNMPYQVVEYLKDTPSVDELTQLIAKLGISPIQLIRTKEPIFQEQYQGKEYTDEHWIEILHQHPILIERPIVVHNVCAIIARAEDSLEKVLK